ncbi:MAG TPA: hypothetical protein VGH28_34075 [Polyangiaceae bacterium]
MAALAACGTQGASNDAGPGDDGAPAESGADGTSGGDANVPDDGAGPVDAGCGTGVLTQLSATSGAVISGTIAHAGNGDALAVWTQVDSNDGGTNGAMYAAEHQGCTWGAPVQIQTLGNVALTPHPPSLVANQSTFVLLEWLGSATPPRVWTGSGMTSASGTFVNGLLGTDGTTFVDVMFNGQPGYTFSTSTDGLTWTAPASAETVGTFEDQIASGPGGVLAWATDSSTKQERARVWRQGAWSAPAMLSSYGYGACQAAVGNADAVIACLGPGLDGGADYLDVQLYDGSWHDLPPPKQVGAPTVVLLASDGADYRLDYGNPPVGMILHAGTWSPAVNDMASPYGSAGRSGEWSAITVDVQKGYSISRATGGAAFPTPTPLVPVSIPTGTWVGVTGAPFSGWAGRTDVAFVDGNGDGGANTLYVGLDL